MHSAFNNVINRGTLTTGASRGQCNSPEGGSPCDAIFLPSACACKYRAIYFVITCRDISARDHAIGVSARGKITAAWKIYSRARIRHFPLFAVTRPFIFRQRDIIRVQLYSFSERMRITICATSYFAEERSRRMVYIKIQLSNRHK